MLGKNGRHSVYVIRGLQRIKVIWALAQTQTLCAKVVVSLAVTDADPTPVVALQNHQRARKSEALLLSAGS
jgi:hypothetical protein